MNATSANIKAEVKNTSHGPKLFVNGKATAPTIFFVNFELDMTHQEARLDEIAIAAKRGVNLLSITGLMPWKDDSGNRNFGQVDGVMDAVLKANPNAMIIMRFGTSWPPQSWIEKHPGDIMLYDDGKCHTASVHSRAWRHDTAENVTAFVKHMEEKYGEHMLGYHPTGQHTGEWFYDRAWEGRLAGFEPCAITAFRAYLKDKYKTDATLRQAWHDPDASIDTMSVPTMREKTRCTAGSFRDPMVEQKVIDFFEFENHDMATAVEDLCKAVRAGTPDKLAVAFYGYPFELGALPYGPQAGGHQDIAYLLKSPHVDVLASPVSYLNREPGGGGFFMTTVDSVQKHGKLWLVEDDTRTYLTEPEAGFGRCADLRESLGVLTRNFGHIVTHGTAVWWMDLGGSGWFRSDDLWKPLSGLQTAYQESIDRVEPYHAEIAVILDEKSCLYMEPDRKFSEPLLGTFRKEWYRIGAPSGIYLMDDLIAGKVPPAKMYIMLNAFSLSEAQLQAVRKSACRKGCTVVWMYAPGIIRDGKLDTMFVQDTVGISIKAAPIETDRIVLEGSNIEFNAQGGKHDPTFEVIDKDAKPIARYAGTNNVAIAEKKQDGWTSVFCGVLQMPASTLRRLARDAGVHIYADSDDVVSAGNGFVSIHASTAGHKTVNMPSECEMIDVATGKSLGKGRSFEFDMQLGDTRLMKVVR